MRVLVVTNMYPTDSEPWFGCFVREQVEDLRGLGLEVDVLRVDGRADWRAYPRAVPALRARVRKGGYDVVHAHYGLTGAVALAQRLVPVVTTFHGSDTGYVAWQGRVSWAVARRAVPIFVSRHGALRLALPNAAVIPVGVDVDLFRPIDRDEARARLGWEVDASYVLFPGSPANRVKRFDRFEQVLAHVSDERPDVRPVALTGYSRVEAALALNAADVTLMTSDWEGSPLTVRESLACATPVVSVQVGDVPETLNGLPGCAVVEREPSVLAAAVLRALRAGRPPELRRRAQDSAREIVAGRVASLYADLVGAAA